MVSPRPWEHANMPIITSLPPPPANGNADPNPSSKDASAPTELVKVDPADVGMSVGFKHLYSGKEDKRGRFQWQPTIPEDVGKPAEDAESEKWAIIVRHVKVFNDAKRVLGVHSIVVQSPLLKDLLKDVLHGYPGVTVGLKRLEFSGLFEPLIHRWDALNTAIDKLKSLGGDEAKADDKLSQRIEHAGLLRELLATEFKDTIEASTDLKSQGVINYEYLWTIFQPGTFVYSKQQGQDRVFRLQSSRYGFDRNGNDVMMLNCSFVDYDGTRFGTNKLTLNIHEFEGTKPITALSTYPFEFHAHKDEVRTRLIERGEKVENFAGSHYRWYNGVGWRFGNMGNKEKYTVKGRIVIDTYGWNRFNPNMCIFVTPFHVKDSSLGGIFLDIPPPPIFVEGGEDDYDGDDNSDVGIPMDGNFAEEESEEQVRIKLTEDQRLMCSPLVRGYALKEKTWLNFFVNSVQEITFSTSAFECLVLPDKQKELILGFTETQQTHRSYFDDVIESKGRGIIVLLCGPPGVGKTLTAESVAEEMKVPLFMMSAGDLGLDPRSVESKLRGILDMCTRWNAILLLDEADVFLEQRSLHELERNKLVSIFLRVLEYFEGIMFLTTNRVTTFDAAFQSRIHISLEYSELDFSSRKTVWQNFLRQHDIAQATARERPLKALASAAKVNGTVAASNDGALSKEESQEAMVKSHEARTHPHAMTPAEIDKLSRLSLNGRQIKNILKTAQLLASRRGQGLSYDHIQTVMEVTQHLHHTTRESERVKATFFS